MNSLFKLALLTLVSGLMVAPTLAMTHMVYDSELAAVRAAADIYNPLSIREDREYMGTIFKQGDKFLYTVNAGKKRADSISIRVSLGDWDELVAFWHTHGARHRGHQYFSDIDTAMVNRTGKPLYLADYNGFLKIFKPGEATISAFAAGGLGLPPEKGFSFGKTVRDSFKRIVRVKTRPDQASS